MIIQNILKGRLLGQAKQPPFLCDFIFIFCRVETRLKKR